MLDRDLAELYKVPTKRLNEQVQRNRSRFPHDFMFRLTVKEAEMMRSQNATASRRNVRFRPLAFTELGVAMLSSVLTSERAVQVNIAIMRTFVRIRLLLARNGGLARRIRSLEKSSEQHDLKFQMVFLTIRKLAKTKVVRRRKQIGFTGN